MGSTSERWQQAGQAAVKTAGAVVLGVMLAGSAVHLLARLTGRAWQRLGPDGQCVAAMIAVWPAVLGLSELGVIADGDTPLVFGAGLSGTAFFGLVRAVVRARGQRQWRRRDGGSVVVHPGWQEYVQTSDAAAAVRDARLDALETQADNQFERIQLVYDMLEEIRTGVSKSRRRLHAVRGSGEMG